MDHNELRHRLSEFIDNAMPPRERTEMEEHLRTCSECGSALQELQKTIEQLNTVEEVEPPAWMSQKIMARVRSEAEKRSLFRRIFSPLALRLPVRAVAVLFLAVTAFYIYRTIQPTRDLAEAPVRELTAEKEAQQTGAANVEAAKAKAAQPRSRELPQTPGYKALDMTKEYEPVQTPAPATSAEIHKQPLLAERKALPQAVAPAKSTAQTEVVQGYAAPDSGAKGGGAPALKRERTADSARAALQTDRIEESGVPQKDKSLSGKVESRENIERVVLKQHANGRPQIVVTYEVHDSRKVKLGEERFNAEGKRDGLQKEYYASGQVKAEVQYENGRLEWYKEYSPDGIRQPEKAGFDWFWLKK